MEELLRAGEKMKVKKGIVSLPVSMISIEDWSILNSCLLTVKMVSYKD